MTINFTVPTSKEFLKVRSQNVSGNKQELVIEDGKKKYFFDELAIVWLPGNDVSKTFIFPFSITFPH